ncbi:MAG: hypothetical protein KDI63_15140 [Gammaproteobacteria bacterium]|nr:hypothetical protein [Gammaproteobacteria bacterium]
MVLEKSAKKKVATRTAKKRVAGKRMAKKAAPAVQQKSPTQDAEKTFAQARIQLAKTRESEVTKAKKEAEKLQLQLSKTIERQKALQEKKAAAMQKASEKNTQAIKNQVERARLAVLDIGTKIKAMREEIKNARSAHNAAKAAHKKHLAMEKLLDKFERDWAKRTAAKPKATRRPRKKAVATPKTPSVTEASS